MRARLALLAILVIAAASIIYAYNSRGEDPANQNTVGLTARPVTLSMGYIPNVQFTPFYVADAEGYFGELNIDATIEHGFVNDLIALVGSGARDFAITDADQVLVARSQGVPAVSVMTLYAEAPIGLVFKSDKNIAGPVDLAGKRIGIPGEFGASYTGLIAFLAANGLDKDDVELVTVGYEQVAAVTQDTVDAAVVFTNNEPVLLENAGVAVTTIPFAASTDFAGAVLVTNETLLQDKPELVRDVVGAVRRAMTTTRDNPDAAFGTALTYITDLTEDQHPVQREVLTRSVALWQPEPSIPLGFHIPALWVSTRDLLAGQDLLGDNPADNAYTNNFITQ
jgi:NitT/TauT family transport system substrate-binding protein